MSCYTGGFFTALVFSFQEFSSCTSLTLTTRFTWPGRSPSISSSLSGSSWSSSLCSNSTTFLNQSVLNSSSKKSGSGSALCFSVNYLGLNDTPKNTNSAFDIFLFSGLRMMVISWLSFRYQPTNVMIASLQGSATSIINVSCH